LRKWRTKVFSKRLRIKKEGNAYAIIIFDTPKEQRTRQQHLHIASTQLGRCSSP